MLLTKQEEKEVIKFYALKIFTICEGMEYSEKIKLTAVTFYRRFYLLNSTMNFDPSQVLVTSIFLAAKVEENRLTDDKRGIDLSKLILTLNKSQKKKSKEIKFEDILRNEINLLEGVKFHLLVFHTRDLLEYFIEIFKISLPGKVLSDCLILENFIYSSDLLFLFTPAQLAIFLIKNCSSLENEEIFQNLKISDEISQKKFLLKLEEIKTEFDEAKLPINKVFCKASLKKLNKIQEKVITTKSKRKKT